MTAIRLLTPADAPAVARLLGELGHPSDADVTLRRRWLDSLLPAR